MILFLVMQLLSLEHPVYLIWNSRVGVIAEIRSNFIPYRLAEAMQDAPEASTEEHAHPETYSTSW
jgi:hypothetical protein